MNSDDTASVIAVGAPDQRPHGVTGTRWPPNTYRSLTSPLPDVDAATHAAASRTFFYHTPYVEARRCRTTERPVLPPQPVISPRYRCRLVDLRRPPPPHLRHGGDRCLDARMKNPLAVASISGVHAFSSTYL